MAVSSAVFIRSSKTFPEIIGACQQLFQTMRSEAKIVGFMEDVIYGGFKMYFSDEHIVEALLKKKFLFDSEEASIYPLITRLTIRKVFPISEVTFRKELLDNLTNLGPVADIIKIPVSAEFPDIGSGDWRVVLDVPEIKDLDVFKKFGLPDEMLIKLPSIFDHLTVKFFCNRCKLDGHTQFDCEIDDCLAAQIKDHTGTASVPPTLKPQKVPRVRLETVKVSKKAKSPTNKIPCPKKPNTSENSHPALEPTVICQNSNTDPNSNLEKSANSGNPNLDPEIPDDSRNLTPDAEISSNSGNPNTDLNISSNSGNPSSDTNVSSNSTHPNTDLNVSSNSGYSNPDFSISSNSENPTAITTNSSNAVESAKQIEEQNISSIIPECLNIKKEVEDSADESSEPPRKKRLAFTLANVSANFIEPDDDIYNPAVSRTTSLLFSPAATIGFPRGSADDSVSTSNLTEVLTELVKTEYRSEDENDPEFREDRRKAAYRKRKKPTLDQPILIPERIRSIIDDKTNGPLKADTMEAFFTHTKKKSKPCEIAKIFHPDVEALKTQLDTVQREYYSTNAAPRKEEREFMKWFVGMLQRFYGTVSVRRRH